MARRAPDVKGQYAEAWLCTPHPQTAAEQAALATYLVKMPNTHPLWDHWIITAVHLRDIEGAPPAKKQYPEAEYELMILALNPEENPAEIDPDNLPRPLPWLSPPDAIVQFHCNGMDQAAVRITQLVIETIGRGRVSPDQDFRSFWEQSIKTTAQHYREGRHAVS